jgi:acyl carrier protein
MTTLQSMQGIFKANFDFAPDVLQREAVLEDLEIDSLSMIEVLFAVEDEFKIVVPHEPAAWRGQTRTFGDRWTMSTSSSLHSIQQWLAGKCQLETGRRHRDRRDFPAGKRSGHLLQ